MRGFAALWCAALTLSCATSVRAAPLTLAQAIDVALSHNIDVVRQVAVVEQNRAAYVRQRAQGLPALTAEAQNSMSKSENYGGNFAVIGAQQANVFTQNTEQVQSTYTYYTGGLSKLQTLLAQEQFDQSQAELRRTKDATATTVADEYFTIAQRAAAVRLDRSDLAYQNALVVIARAKVKAGVVAGVDVLRAQVAQQKSASALVAAGADEQNASELLAQTIGVALTTTFAASADVPEPPLPAQSPEQLAQLAQTHRAEVASALDALAIAQTNRKTLNEDLYPNIALQAGFGNLSSPTLAAERQAAIDQQFFATNEQLIASGQPPLPLSDKPLVPRGSPGFWNISAITTLSLPLVDYGTRRASRANFERQVTSAQGVLDATRSQVTLDVRQAYRSAATALAQLRYAAEEVRLGRESARVARLQYQAGVIALSDVLQAQRDAVSADTDLANARVAYVEAVVKLRLATGLFTDGSVAVDLR